MPSKSQDQHNFMAAVKHSPKFASEVGVSQSVASEFIAADKGKKYDQGGYSHPSKQHIVNALRRRG